MILVKGENTMKEAYISYADEQTGYTYNVQIVVNGIYTKESFYENDIWDAITHAETIGCQNIFTTF